MAFNKNLGVRGLSILAKKIPYKGILKGIIVVGILRKYISIVY